LAERCEHPYSTEFRVHGRGRDVLQRRDGRRVTTLEVDRCFAGAESILHYHLRQRENGDCYLQFIPDREPPASGTIRAVTDQLRELLQAAAPVVAEPVKLLPPLTSGKFRLTAREER
jgi:hypothetical protein